MIIAGVRIDPLDTQSFLKNISEDIDTGRRGYVVTPYSEFFLHAEKDPAFKEALLESHYSLADGFGVILASKYLSMKPGLISLSKCLWKACTDKSFFDGEIQHKISGSEVIYDVSKTASEKGWRVFFLGGLDLGNGNTGELAAAKLKNLYPNLIVAGTYEGSPKDDEAQHIIDIVDKAQPDILFVAYGPVKQEKWLHTHIQSFKKPLIGFGLGGTFDYVAGSKKFAPKWVRNAGIEGILRPFISEGLHPFRMFKRFRRAWFGIIGFLLLLLRSD